jgi:hypothetical protein
VSCRTGCPTQDCESWGACARNANFQIDRHALAGHRNEEKDKDKRLTEYADLRSAGVQPKSTTWKHVRQASETGGTRPTPVTSGV